MPGSSSKHVCKPQVPVANPSLVLKICDDAEVFVIQSLVGHHDYPQYLETLRQLMPNLKYFKLICDFRDVDAWNDFVESGQAPAQAELGLPLTQKDVVSVAQGFIDKLDVCKKLFQGVVLDPSWNSYHWRPGGRYWNIIQPPVVGS